MPVGFEVYIETGNKKVEVLTKNLSMTGISCTTHESFGVNELCTVSLRLNEETHLIIQGKILRVDQQETIISFQSMDEDTFYHLKRLMQFNAADPDKIEEELGKPAFR